MRTDTVYIDNQGVGFENALKETEKAAAYRGLSHAESLHLQLCTEEMLSLARSVTGEMKASFWVEAEEKLFHLHMSTETVMDQEKRSQLLASATSQKNEAAKGFLGYLRDAFEKAMTAEVNHGDELPVELLTDLPNRVIEDPTWDGYEQSTLRRLADSIKIGIRGGLVDMTVSKQF